MSSRARRDVGQRRPSSSRGRARPREPQPFVLPSREWDRGTEIIRLFAATGWVANAKPQSVMLISEPGSGKTELIDRFKQNPWLEFASDLTVRGLYSILKRARQGAVTHLVATEFQKYFMRKAATADNMLGTLCQAMEEGVGQVIVGEKPLNFAGAQLGFIGAITHDTMSDRRKLLTETGFVSRAAIFEWEMSAEEVYDVMSSINRGDKSDLSPVIVPTPDRKVTVDLPAPLSRQFQDYIWQKNRKGSVLRIFQRFRALAMASAVLDGRDVVHAVDIEKVVSFEAYWDRVWTG